MDIAGKKGINNFKGVFMNDEITKKLMSVGRGKFGMIINLQDSAD